MLYVVTLKNSIYMLLFALLYPYTLQYYSTFFNCLIYVGYGKIKKWNVEVKKR